MNVMIVSLNCNLDNNPLQVSLDRLGYTHKCCVLSQLEPGDVTAYAGLFALYLADTDQPEQLKLQLTRLQLLCDIVFFNSARQCSACSEHILALEICSLPVNDDELLLRLERLQRFYVPSRVSESDSILDAYCLASNMVGRSPQFRQALHTIRKFSMIQANVLILGETGTGKELAARATHYLGANSKGPFQAVNCSAIPDHLFENELFGHERGAYTDAKNMQPGMVRLAEGGTLFLDEVDTLSPAAQTKLLRFLQDGSFRPLGSNRDYQAKVRIISASNSDLNQLANTGLFRKDLLFRLKLLVLNLPPLRNRREDIAELADYFLRRCELEYAAGRKVLHPLTRQKMHDYAWPGNVRELENFIQRQYLLNDNGLIISSPQKEDDVSDMQVGSRPAFMSFSEAKDEMIEHFEREYVQSVLLQAKGNVTEAARIAGKERRALGKLMKKHGIDRELYC